MTSTERPTAADSQRATALLRATLTGDVAAYDAAGAEALALGRVDQLAAPLVQVAARFIRTMIDQGAVSATQVMLWLDRIESSLIDAELHDQGDDDPGRDPR